MYGLWILGLGDAGCGSQQLFFGGGRTPGALGQGDCRRGSTARLCPYNVPSQLRVLISWICWCTGKCGQRSQH